VTELREQQLRLERALQEAKDVVKIRYVGGGNSST
jgi:hypothetical protein